MKPRQKKIYISVVLVLLPVMLLGLLIGSFFLFAPKALRSWCRSRGVEYQYSACSFRLPGKLTLTGFQLQRAGEFSFSAEHLQWDGSLWACLFGKWNAKKLQMKNATLQIDQVKHTGKVQLSNITLELQDIAQESRATGILTAAVDEIDLPDDGILKGGNLKINSLFKLSRNWLFDHMQGQIAISEATLSQGEQALGSLSCAVDYALRQEAADSWQIIPGAGEAVPINHIQALLSGREVVHAVIRSGYWKKMAERQEAGLELAASGIDSEPLLALFSRKAYAWASGSLKYLQLDLRSQGRDMEDLLCNVQGSVAFDITELQLKNSPFIEVLSKKTGLELSEFLLFNRGSGLLKIANQTCRVVTTAPFQGQHPVIEANGTVSFEGRMNLRLELGFSLELEKLLSTKRYFLPFAMLCHRNNGYLMLPGSLTLTGALESPAVDLTELLKASARAGMKNLFEDAAGRIGIRLQRSDKGAKE